MSAYPMEHPTRHLLHRRRIWLARFPCYRMGSFRRVLLAAMPAGRNKMRYASVSILAFLSIFFGWLFYERYWKFRDCISQALSSCLTPDGDNLTQGGSLWAGLAGLFLLLAVISAWRIFRSRDAGK
ncbi:hypothetical protein CUJ84_Chr000128 [Rhizobium leguminosarum]|uniref:Uncharacterized protein n=1 Tax=Rhizobium leguminosarum TaxID=384 RepID=A0A2K9YX43_RHILE|nr:hypothetical protein CUJ84_Chr000128 [Rhizobium leguminosarum]